MTVPVHTIFAADCHSCPFSIDASSSNEDGDEFSEYRCAVDDAQVYDRSKPPDWCPLREAPVLVSLRTKESP